MSRYILWRMVYPENLPKMTEKYIEQASLERIRELEAEVERLQAVHAEDVLHYHVAVEQRDEAEREIERLRTEVCRLKEALFDLTRERDELRQEKATDAWYTGWQEAVRRMQQAERERDDLRARLDRADCTHREGGDTRHCRHDRLCWHCRHDEAVALLRDGAVLIRGYGDGKYPDYPEGLLVAIDKWLARLGAALKEPL